MTENEIRAAAASKIQLQDFDGEIGIPTGKVDTDGETIVAEIVGPNFRRWADILDLQPTS